jgi:hypothetical protein
MFHLRRNSHFSFNDFLIVTKGVTPVTEISKLQS